MPGNSCNTTVSVGLPVFNRPNLLKMTLQSMLNQSYKDLEIIISDDCSPNPEVISLIEEFIIKDSRIKLFKQKVNIGAILNHQFVLQKATGKYFFWASEDDIWDENFIETGVYALSGNSNYHAWLCTVNNTDSYGRVIRKYDGFSRFTSTRNKWKDIIKYLLEPGILGKGNIFHSLFLRESLINTIKETSYKSSPAFDICFNFAFLIRFNLIAIDKVMFQKRVVRNSDRKEKADLIIIKDPYRYSIISPRFYFEYYRVARKTKYKYLVLFALILIWPYMLIRKYLSPANMKNIFNKIFQKVGYRIVKVR